MSQISSFDATQNFWKLYPQFKLVGFKSLHDNDKSKGKAESSTMMWFIVYCYDRGSSFYKLPIEDKHTVVGEDYCGNKNYYYDHQIVLDSSIELYIKLQYTKMERHLKVWEDLLDKRTKFLQTQEYDLSTYEDLDKMAVGTQKVHQTIKQVLDDLSKEDSADGVKGGTMPSYND